MKAPPPPPVDNTAATNGAGRDVRKDRHEQLASTSL